MEDLIPEDFVPGVNAPPMAEANISLASQLLAVEKAKANILDTARSRRTALLAELADLDDLLGADFAPAAQGQKRGKKGSPPNPRGAVLEAVKAFFTANDSGAYTAKAVVMATGYSLESVRSSIRTAVKAGHIMPVERGRFTLRTHGNA